VGQNLLLPVRLLTIHSASREPINSYTEIAGAKELDIGSTFLSPSRQVVDFHARS
jgi:hypothetical protein